jgi:hypothetical protein
MNRYMKHHFWIRITPECYEQSGHGCAPRIAPFGRALAPHHALCEPSTGASGVSSNLKCVLSGKTKFSLIPLMLASIDLCAWEGDRVGHR